MIFTRLTVLLFLLYEQGHSARRKKSDEFTTPTPPNIYRWIADNAYLCNPTRLDDGTMISFLSEEEGLKCGLCDRIPVTDVPAHACASRIEKNSLETEIDCFKVPTLCIEDFILRYATFEKKSAVAENDVIMSTTDRENVDDNSSTEDENGINSFEKTSTLSNKVIDQLRSSTPQDKEKMLKELEKAINERKKTTLKSSKIDESRPLETLSTTRKSTTTTTSAEFEDITDPTMLAQDVFEESRTILPASENVVTFPGDSQEELEEANDLPPASSTLPPTLLPFAGENSDFVTGPTEELERIVMRPVAELIVGEKEELPQFMQNSNEDTIIMEKRRGHFGTTTTTPPPPSTLPTTTKPRECKDMHTLCCFWAVAGECESNPFWMRINCPKTCGTCNCTLRKADRCVSTGLNCTLPTTTTTTTTTTPPPTTIRLTTTQPTTKPEPPTTKKRITRPFTPPKNGFRRTQPTTPTIINTTTASTTTLRTTTTTTTTTTTPTTTTTTPTTTTTEDPCKDFDSHCSFWASLGECEVNPYWMRPHCQRSCKSCGQKVEDVFAPTPRKGCQNGHQLCNFWASTGECDINPNWMVPHCPLSCMIC